MSSIYLGHPPQDPEGNRKAHPGFQGGGSRGVILGIDSVGRRNLSAESDPRDVQRWSTSRPSSTTPSASRRSQALCSWPDGVRCPGCGFAAVNKDGHDDTQPERRRYQCQGVAASGSTTSSGTIFAGHHQPLRVWVLCLDFMGLNLSNEQIAHELDIDPDDAPPRSWPLNSVRGSSSASPR